MRLLNTHLESGADFSDTRTIQLKECFDQLSCWDDGETFVVFGGDLNLRDKEVPLYLLLGALETILR